MGGGGEYGKPEADYIYLPQGHRQQCCVFTK